MVVIDGQVVKFIELFAEDISAKGKKKLRDAHCWNDNWDYMPVTVLEFCFEEGEGYE